MFGDLELIDVLYNKLWQSEELTALLGNPQNSTERNEKIRREVTPVKLITADKLNFISMYFSAATETDNIYVVRGFLIVEYYTKSREDLRKIQRAVKQILEKRKLLRVSFYNMESFAKGIFGYTEKYSPLVFA